MIFLTETKVYTRSAINSKGFQGFSVVRDKNMGGGIFLGKRHGLYETVMIDSGDKAQFVTVLLTNKDFNAQIVLVYVPQEKGPEDIRESFCHDVSVQIQTAYLNGDSVILIVDFNAKPGHSVVQNDIHPVSKNGEVLFDMFNNYNMKLLNPSKSCTGTFTRIHKYRQEIEKSVLEYAFVSSDPEKHFISMHIDESKDFTPWRKFKSGKRFSNHCAIKFSMNLKSLEQAMSSKRVKVWNFNGSESWKKFCTLTKSLDVSDMWSIGKNIEDTYQTLKRKFNNVSHKCFRKKRVGNRGVIYSKEIRNLIEERKKLKSKLAVSFSNSNGLKQNIRKLDTVSDQKISDFNIAIIKKSIGKTGEIDKQSFWKIKKLLAPKAKEMPHSVLASHDNLLTDPVTIRNEYKTEFQNRLTKRDIRSGLEWFGNFQNRLCKLRVKTTGEIQSPDFTFSEVKEIVSKLKTGKSTDPTGFIRKLFKCAGDGLLSSILEMVNPIKKSKYIPDEWNTVWIRTLKKKRGTSKSLTIIGVFLLFQY